MPTAIRPWTAANVRYLRSRAGKSKATAIATRLKRSEGAVRQKARELGISLDTRG